YGAGCVVYSTIPLDYYLAGAGPNPPRDNFNNIYAPNVVAYAASSQCAAAAGPPPCALTAPVPTAPTNVGTFPPDGLLHYDPLLMRPFDLDDAGANYIGTLMLPCWKNGHVAIYLVVSQSPYGQLVMNEFHRWLPYPANVVPWKAYTADAVYAQLFSYLKSTVAAGAYQLDVIVVPSGTPTSAIPGIVTGTATTPYYKWRFTKTL
ncbi:MAG: hypothetical protein HZA23_08430, partial [Nitrospirae bacterium]|nr:hypothetical protein [Nitrospirota bacterium]